MKKLLEELADMLQVVGRQTKRMDNIEYMQKNGVTLTVDFNIYSTLMKELIDVPMNRQYQDLQDDSFNFMGWKIKVEKIPASIDGRKFQLTWFDGDSGGSMENMTIEQVKKQYPNEKL